MYLDESDFDFDEISADSDDGSGCVCDHCGEEMSINVDVSQGAFQQFVQDCPVC
ncbi:CPXCG motif-containing cysteine-rich protein [Mariniblastus sp.]|nr:CPXCG motif-containing cysteine-rich protein [Mariniblastus sp.]